MKKSTNGPNSHRNQRLRIEGGKGRVQTGLLNAFDAIARVQETLNPAHFYIHLKPRRARTNVGNIELETVHTGWRPVAKYSGDVKDVRNTIAREIALNVGNPDEPLFDDHPFVLRYEKFLLECAQDPRKRQFLRSIALRYPDLVHANSRQLTHKLETRAKTCFDECRKALGINPDLEALMLQHSWNSKPGYENFPNGCKVWMVLVLMWMIDQK